MKVNAQSYDLHDCEIYNNMRLMFCPMTDSMSEEAAHFFNSCVIPHFLCITFTFRVVVEVLCCVIAFNHWEMNGGSETFIYDSNDSSFTDSGKYFIFYPQHQQLHLASVRVRCVCGETAFLTHCRARFTV